MPLSRPVSRELVHTREIRCCGLRREDGLWDIEGLLEDTKTYSFANRDRDGIVAGEPVHRMLIRLTLDEDLVVKKAEAATDAGPFHLCPAITPVFEALQGLRIGPGWRKAVLAVMGGVAGCTHLTDLLLGPVTTTAMQTVAGARARRQQAEGADRPPPMLDACHALARDGDVVRRQWPQWYRERSRSADAEADAPSPRQDAAQRSVLR